MNAHSFPPQWTSTPPSEQGAIACWTRMQAEAGQGLERIVARKETERRAGSGLFFWGIGNPPATATAALARMGAAVPVYFSVMKSKPKSRDVAPDRIVAWRRFVDADGTVRDLPSHVVVTSRASSRGCHYALACHSDRPLSVADHGAFDPSDWRNLGGTGAPVGSSQVTALLRRVACSGGGEYRIAMRAELAGGYWVKLIDPIEVSSDNRAALESPPTEPEAWLSFARTIKQLACDTVATGQSANQYGLFTI